MSTPITKYLLFVPVAYLAYCAYADHNLQSEKDKQQKQNVSDSIKSLSAKFNQCKSSAELANIFKKTFKLLRNEITEPSHFNDQIIDCQILQSSQPNDSWWIYPYSTTNLVKVNRYNQLQNRKQGYYTFLLFFWFNLTTKQNLKLVKAEAEIQAVKKMISERTDKCLAIAKKKNINLAHQLQNEYIDCIRKSQGTARIIEKELARIEFMKDYQKVQ